MILGLELELGILPYLTFLYLREDKKKREKKKKKDRQWAYYITIYYVTLYEYEYPEMQ